MRFARRCGERIASLIFSTREIERPGGPLQVRAPARWTSAQVEAWMDWAGGEGLPQGDLAETARAYALRLAEAGGALTLFCDENEALRFRGEVEASLLLGLAAPGATAAGPT